MHTYLPAMRAHGLLERCFCLMTGGREQGFVIVERDKVENQVSTAGWDVRSSDSVQPVHS